MEEDSREALWYVVHTYSGYENKVAQDLQTMVENRHLEDMICEIKVPVEEVHEIKTIKKRAKGKVTEEQKEVVVEHKLYPGYVFVKMVMTDDTWYIVRNTRGSTGFVGSASKPIPLTPEEVDRMGVDVKTKLSVAFNVGDTVQITAGPLEGFMGQVEEIDLDSYKVKLKVNMFGRETPAEVEISQVELL
ncbi:MAG: transcription termination/antitermination protein NusG [Faecalibacterium sp.]